MEIYQEQGFSKKAANFLLLSIVILFMLQTTIALLSEPVQKDLSAVNSSWLPEYINQYEKMIAWLSTTGFFSLERIIFRTYCPKILDFVDALGLKSVYELERNAFRVSLIFSLNQALFFVILSIKLNFVFLMAGFVIARPLVKAYQANNFFGITSDKKIFDYSLNLTSPKLKQIPTFLFADKARSWVIKKSNIYTLLKAKNLDHHLNLDLLSINFAYADKHSEQVLINLLQVCLQKHALNTNSDKSELQRFVNNIDLKIYPAELISGFILSVLAAHNFLTKSRVQTYSQIKLFITARDILNSIPDLHSKCTRENLENIRQALSTSISNSLQFSKIGKKQLLALACLGTVIYNLLNKSKIEIETIIMIYQQNLLCSSLLEYINLVLKKESDKQKAVAVYNQQWVSVNIEESVKFFNLLLKQELHELKKYFEYTLSNLKPEQQIMARQESHRHNIDYQTVISWFVYRQFLLHQGLINTKSETALIVACEQNTVIRTGQFLIERSILSRSDGFESKLYDEFKVYKDIPDSEKSSGNELNPYFLA